MTPSGCSRGLVRDGDAVFFVGNSFLDSEGRRLPDWVAALGSELRPPIHIEVGADIVFGNTPLAGFFTHPATQAALASHRYKVFVLQGEEFEPVDHKREFHEAVRTFNRAVVAAGVQTVLFMTWDFPYRPFIEALADSYDEIGRELGIPVIPVGLVYQDCRQTHPQKHARFWLTATAEHPEGALHENAIGMAASTYATFAMLTGVNPAGRNFTAPGNTNSDGLMRSLSDMAWAWVAPRLQTARSDAAACPTPD